ncbi:hypothetical protein STENM223S_10673 [Streptomyces tendae]
MSVPQLDAEHRGEEILAVFDTAFGRLLAADPAAFRVKFRKMAASAFAFYRGTAGLFYRDLTEDPEFGDQPGGAYLDERTSRVWIHGDLHAENFGTYMDSTGRLTPGTGVRRPAPPARRTGRARARILTHSLGRRAPPRLTARV